MGSTYGVACFICYSLKGNQSGQKLQHDLQAAGNLETEVVGQKLVQQRLLCLVSSNRFS